jgi:hypothetical protein
MTCKSIWSESISIHLLRSSHRKLFKFLKSSQLVMDSQWTNKGKLVNEMVPSASNGTILDIIHSLLKIIKTAYENSCIRARVRIRSGRLLLYSFMSWRKVIEKIERTYWPRKKCRIEIVNEETRRFLSLYFLAFSSILKARNGDALCHSCWTLPQSQNSILSISGAVLETDKFCILQAP